MPVPLYSGYMISMLAGILFTITYVLLTKVGGSFEVSPAKS